MIKELPNNGCVLRLIPGLGDAGSQGPNNRVGDLLRGVLPFAEAPS